MKKLYLICIGILFGTLLFLCCKKETDPIILVTSDNFVSPMETGTFARFKIEAKSSKNTITRIEIKEYSSDYGYKMLKDTFINKDKSVFFFEYKTPSFASNQEVKLIFIAYNDKDGTSSVSLSYDYIFADELLIEYSGYTMYTLKSGKPDGFSLDAKQVVYTNAADESSIDFYPYQDTNTLLEPNLLQRTWRSYTNLNFVKFNGFDYAKATRKSLTESYLSGLKLPIVINIESEDVILVGFGDTPKAVIKIIGVFDEEGYVNDRYFFNVKFIE